MPKLPKKTAERVAANESDGFAALPENIYPAVLKEVSVKEGPSGEYWSWEFEVEGGEFDGRKLWVNTSLSEKADWKMKEVFDAFGYSTDSDTDELIGLAVRLTVTQRVIDRGARKGQIGNNVDTVLSSDETASESEDELL